MPQKWKNDAKWTKMNTEHTVGCMDTLCRFVRMSLPNEAEAFEQARAHNDETGHTVQISSKIQMRVEKI